MLRQAYLAESPRRSFSPRSLLAAVALRKLDELRALQEAEEAERRAQLEEQGESTEVEIPGLVDWVAATWPHLDRFDYFLPYAEVLESAIGASYRVWFAAPPQHGKTELTLRAFLFWAKFYPGYRHAYVTYSRERAREMAEQFRALAIDAGLLVSGTLGIVRIEGGTEVRFTSIQGGLTGAPITGVCVIDDPTQDREHSLNAAHRRRFKSWWMSVARTRRHPGTSFIGMGTRWGLDDAGGYLVDKEKFRYVNLKAIAIPKNAGDLTDDGRVASDPLHRFPGESLCPWKPPEFFDEDKTDLYWWSAMFQGEPVPVGSNVFAEPGTVTPDGIRRGALYYKQAPGTFNAGAFGLDLAYTAKTSADWSICIEGFCCGEDLYVVDCYRKQVEATDFADTLILKRDKRPGWKMRWYASGTEKGSAQFIRKKLRKAGSDPFRVLTAVGDKRTRSIGVAARWNAGRVLLPDPSVYNVPWLSDFLEVVTRFTGVDDEHDDDVDALSALHDQLFHRSRMAEALA
jgi:predicted phage terminase large subunit-like protein